MAVFAGIMVIEAIILVPSYYRFETTWLQTLEQKALTGYHSMKQSAEAGEVLGQEQLQNLIETDAGIVAIARYRSGSAEFTLGESEDYWPEHWPTRAGSKLLSRERYQTFWEEEGDKLAVVLDSSELQPELNAYVMRILGLVIIIAGFVTLVTSLSLRYLVFGPILLLRSKLEAESQDPLNPRRYIIDKIPNHELGDIITRFNQLQGILHDNIVKIEQQRERLEQANRQLRIENCERTAAMYEAERANRLKSEFLHNMSHELRTPMHAILSFSELGGMETDDGERESLKEYFTLINTSGQQLLGLLNDLLDLSKLEAGKVDYQMAEENPVQLVKDVMHQLSPLLTEKQQKLDILNDQSVPMISCDKVRIRQVLTNLMGNAIKFSPDGSTIAVELECEKQGSEEGITLKLKDQGVGIPEDELEAIFDKFTQSSKNASGSGGTGLGLAISREIINDHGGSVHATNRRSGGACFRIWLPLKQDESYRSKVLD
ncbi:sensor histidine kinase [Spongorhabdus nitratireducens]